MVTDLLRSRPPPGAGGGDVLPNYWNPARGQPETILPINNREGAGSTGCGAWGNEVQLTAGLASDVVLLAAHISQVMVQSGDFWYELRAGPAGANSPIATFGWNDFITGSGAAPIVQRPFRLQPYLLPAGTRLAIRGYSDLPPGSTTYFGAFVSAVPPAPTATWYSPWPNTYIGGTLATVQYRLPAVPGWQSVSNVWTMIIGLTNTPHLITAAELNPADATGGPGQVVEIGTGAQGAEVAHTRIPFCSTRIFGFVFGHQESGRKGLILAGERVAARLISGDTPRNMGFYFEDLP